MKVKIRVMSHFSGVALCVKECNVFSNQEAITLPRLINGHVLLDDLMSYTYMMKEGNLHAILKKKKLTCKHQQILNETFYQKTVCSVRLNICPFVQLLRVVVIQFSLRMGIRSEN